MTILKIACIIDGRRSEQFQHLRCLDVEVLVVCPLLFSMAVGCMNC